MRRFAMLLSLPLLVAGCATTGDTAAAGATDGGAGATSKSIPFAVKCTQKSAGWCEEYVGTFAATDATYATTACLMKGGKFGALTCPTEGLVAGSCVLDPVPFGTGATGKRLYGAAKFTPESAQADCTNLGKKWSPQQ
ncbi:MAG: hypothetical protein WCC48_10595 [Anaeromyxobacteraceae bacterium]